MHTSLVPLTRKSLLLLLAYAPAGLGHLRVTDALYQGLPHEAYPYLLGSQDTRITYIHRVFSVHPWSRAVFEWLERGTAQEVTTYLYRWFLRSNTELLNQQITTILDQRLHTPDTLLVVATHFGLAHQAAELKDRIMHEKKLRMRVVVQVTDDTPHPIWYVTGADLIFVPSDRTKGRLEAYGRAHDLPPVHFEVNPYPVDPRLLEPLNAHEYQDRTHQLSMSGKNLIHMAIPISGAAVGTDFFTDMMDALHQQSNRFMFHIVTKNAGFTKKFIYELHNRPYADIAAYPQDRQVIEAYEQLYREHNISLEVTKPSEQAFKGVVEPNKRGGVILLFADPVGTQEDDNFAFLQRHELTPSKTDQQRLFNLAADDTVLINHTRKDILKKAASWRGILLPVDPKKTAQLIWWCLREGIFTAMMSAQVGSEKGEHRDPELRNDGVRMFWEKVTDLLSTHPGP